MAGNPKKRARELQAALQAAPNVDPDELHTAAPAPGAVTRGLTPLDTDQPGYTRTHARTHAHARTRAREPEPVHRVPIGPTTRNSVDQRTAADLATLANQLAPGLTVRLERLRPTWAAGWVEDVPIDDADLGGLLEYLSHEHGGQMYRATVLASDGSQLYTARVPVAGPPRRRGRVLHREQWEGLPDPTTAAPVVAQVERRSDLADTVALMRELTKQSDDSRAATLEAVREMQKASERQTQALLGAMFRGNNPAPDFREQLQQFRQTAEAVDEIREVLGGGERNAAPAAPSDDDRPQVNRILERIAADALSQGLRNDAQRGAAPSAPPQPQRAPQPARPNHARRVQPRSPRKPGP